MVFVKTKLQFATISKIARINKTAKVNFMVETKIRTAIEEINVPP